MFVDKPIGDPLKRKQLKWLLIILGVVMVVAVLVYVFMQSSMSGTANQPVKNDMTASEKPTQEEIQKQLDMLAAEDAKNPTPKPTQEEIEKQLEALAAEDAKDPTPKPSQEEIEKQMEMLSKQ